MDPLEKNPRTQSRPVEPEALHTRRSRSLVELHLEGILEELLSLCVGPRGGYFLMACSDHPEEGVHQRGSNRQDRTSNYAASRPFFAS
jgi:hypothetical protein